MTPISRRRFIAVTATFGAGAFLSATLGAKAKRVHWSGFAMGASASLLIVGMRRQDAESLIGEVQNELERLEAIFSLYRADSAIVQLNRNGYLDAPPLDLVALLACVNAIHDATDGTFDPTVQPLWRLLAETKGAPAASNLVAARKLIGWPKVRIASNRVSFSHAGMAVTLNGIAQGYATDRIAGLLRAAGITDVLVSVGEIAALGTDKYHQSWDVGISEREDLQEEEHVSLTNMAIATSAPYGTILSEDGRTGHILDPRTNSSQARWRRVSVIHPSATIADGLSTAFVLMAQKQIADAASIFHVKRIIAIPFEGDRLDLLL